MLLMRLMIDGVKPKETGDPAKLRAANQTRNFRARWTIFERAAGRALSPGRFIAAAPEFSADGADGRGSAGNPSALIRVIRG